MTQPAANNPTRLQRVAHVIVVALCTASTLALVGAERAKPAAAKPAQAVAAPQQQVASVAANIMPSTEWRELLQQDDSSDDAAVTAAARIPAVPAAAEPKTRVMRMEVTAYCPCTKCCGENAQGITASGRDVSYNNSQFVAADTTILPFNTKLIIPGYHNGATVPVIDRGGAIKGHKLDLYFPTHEEALEWGRQMIDVTVIE